MSVFEDIKKGLLEAIEYEKGNLKAKTTHIPNEVTSTAIEEGRGIDCDKNIPVFKNMDELKNALEV